MSDAKKIEVKEFNGKILIDFREYYQRQDGGWGPTKKGCSMGVDVWEKFLGSIEEINQAIANKQAGLPE